MKKNAKIKVGQIVYVEDDDGTFLGRVLNVDNTHELVVVAVLNDFFEDIDTRTVSLLNVEKYEGKLNK